MALRLIDIYRPDDGKALNLPESEYDVLGHWTYRLDENQRVDRCLLEVEETETFVDWVNSSLTEEHRVVLQSVEATLPRPDFEEEDEEEGSVLEKEGGTSVGRVGREEMYEYARNATDVSSVYYALIALSTIVAGGGMLRDQTAVVIGAMMIAPLIGPNIALALGTTLGDTPLLWRSVRANVTGVLLALAGAFGMGLFLPIDPATGEVAARTVIGTPDIALAGAAGAAGALAVMRGGATEIVGIMVAVALLPPVVAVGLLLGDSLYSYAADAALLAVTNIVSLNLAAVCTFLLQGVRPQYWHEMDEARTSTRIALALWLLALALLLVVMWWVKG